MDPELPIIDAHHHLFRRPTGSYLLDDYLGDVALGHDVRASVYVETLAMARTTGDESLRPLGEVEFANGVAAMASSGVYGECRVAAAIVGYADLRRGAGISELLDRYQSTATDRFRGVRQVTMDHPDPGVWRFVTTPPPQGVLSHPKFEEGLRALGRRGLSFDAAVFHHQLSELASIARRHPETTIVLNHMGTAAALDADDDVRARVFVEWRNGIRRLAEEPNTVCKVGGLGLPFWGFRLHERTDIVHSTELASLWRPYVETAVDAFGPDRCMLESDFPMDGRGCGWVPLWNALKLIARGYSQDERQLLFSGTARRVYRVAVDPSARK